MQPVFIPGKPVQKVWINMDFDLIDMQKYLNGTPVADQAEADRLQEKYVEEEDFYGEPTKVCKGCREEFPATTEFFLKDASKKGGLRHKCKACFNELPCFNKINKRK
jgi:hypothetical protein